jgi:hypothetical protein
MDILAVVLFFTLVALFAIRAWKGHGRLAGGDRWALITSFALAATTFVVAPLVINWVVAPMVLWLLAVGLLSAGVAGAVLRWPELSWRTGAHPLRRTLRIGATLVSCVLIITMTMI